MGARLYGFANNWGWFGVVECEGGAGGGDEVGREKKWRESGERGQREGFGRHCPFEEKTALRL